MIRRMKWTGEAMAFAVLFLAVGCVRVKTKELPMEPHYVFEPSYIISTDGANSYAQNGLTGKVDFSGEDASKVIQSAIDAVKGGMIFIKSGEYKLSSAIKLKEKIWLRGEGRSTVLRQTARDESGIVYIAAETEAQPGVMPHQVAQSKYGVTGGSYSSSCISNLALAGPGAEGTGNGIHFEYVSTYDGPVVIEKLKVWNFGGWQICTSFCYGGAFVIRDCKIGSNAVGDGVFIDRCNGGAMKNCEVHQVKRGGTGVYLRRSWSFSIHNVVVENAAEYAQGNKAFHIAGWQKGTIIDSCYSECCDWGVYVEGKPDSLVNALTIRGCNFDNTYPIYLDHARNVIIEGNTLNTLAPHYHVTTTPNVRDTRIELNDLRGSGLGVRRHAPAK